MKRKPKHTAREIATISGEWVTTLKDGRKFIPGYSSEKLRRRSKNRAANKRARIARRVTRHAG